MGDDERIRARVSEAYSKAVKGDADGCGCCSSEPVQKGIAAKLAGYTREELGSLPEDAVTNSFGCGNPLAYSEVKEGEVVLDLGSGAGIDILLAAKMVGPTGRAIGVDMTDDMIERARENIAAAGLSNVEVRKGIIEQLPVEDSSVDWVISNCVINLSPDKPKVFAEIARVLRPGGRMHVSDIVVKDLPDWMREDPRLYNSCVGGAIGEDEYLAGLEDAGLAEVEVAERLVYDAAQLNSFIKSELAEGDEASACCAAPAEGEACCPTMPIGEEMFDKLIETFAGQVWSAKFQARKPGK